jgi:hypothetical protein
MKRRSKTHGPIAPNRTDTYDALREKGYGKRKAAAIANAGSNEEGREKMAKKSARTRRFSK